MPKNVLIFAHECAPFHRPKSTIGAQRPAQFAKHLPEFGWRPIVLCCDNERRGWPDRASALATTRADAQRALAAARPEEPVFIPTPSLAYDGLRDKWWHATFTDAGQPRPGRFTAFARKALTFSKFTTGDWSQGWQPCAQAAAAMVTQQVKIDACLGEHGPDAGLLLARWFHRKYRVPWVMDFRDSVMDGYRGFAQRRYARVVRRLLQSCSGTVNVNEFLAQVDRDTFGVTSWAITNGFDPDEFAARAKTTSDALSIVYVGNIQATQRIEPFLEGLARAQQAVGPAALRFIYRGRMAQQVTATAARFGVGHLLDCAGQVTRAEALELMQGAAVLLLLAIATREKVNFLWSQGAYPGKVFEYFGAQKPILCVPGDGAMLDELMRRTRTGVIAATPAEVADYLVNAVRNGVPYAPDTTEVQKYTRRNLTGQLAAILDKTAGHGNKE